MNELEFAEDDPTPMDIFDSIADDALAPTVYPVTALIRDLDAGLRSVLASRDLVRLVAELTESAAVAVEVRTGAQRGRLEMTVELHGTAADELTADDLRTALGAAVDLGEPRTLATSGWLPGEIGSAYELRRIGVAPMFRRSNADAERPEWMAFADPGDGPAFALVNPTFSDAERLLETMAASGSRACIRTVLAPANDLEARLVMDELAAALRPGDIAGYAGTPVRARTVVAGRQEVSAALRAHLRLRSSELRVDRVTRQEISGLWTDPVAAARGWPVAESHAIALLRVPTAGSLGALGIVTRRPVARVRPLDPMPAAPVEPIRLGWARDAYGDRVDVAVEPADLCRHLYIEGASGAGKTSMIRQLVYSLIRANHTVIYLDPHGDGAEAAAAYAHGVDGARARFIRHGDLEHPIGLNPLADPDEGNRDQSISAFLELLQDIVDPGHSGMLGERGKRSISLVAKGAHVVFGSRASLNVVVAILLDRANVRLLASAVRATDPDLATRLRAELAGLGDREYTELISWLVSRLQPFLRTGALRAILGAGIDAVDVREQARAGTSIIVDLASMNLGEEVAAILGALWILKIKAALADRARTRKLFVVVDEAWLYRFGALPDLLAEARKTGTGVIIATQSVDNLAPRLARAVEANVASHVSLRTGARGAAIASDRLGGWTPTELMRLPDLTAATSLSRDGVPTTAFTLRIDHYEELATAGLSRESISSAADAMAEQTRRLLWEPHADARALSDTEILDVVRARSEEGAPPEPGQVPRAAADWWKPAAARDN